MQAELTDRPFWENYWLQKKDINIVIPEDYVFSALLKSKIEKHQLQTAIELGGFPGYYAVFLKKYFNLDVSLLDFFVHKPIMQALLQRNGLKEGDVGVIETDLFNYSPQERFDLVLSCGLIEHFTDTAEIVHKHIELLKPGGTLFITLPNFRGVNGWFQRQFDMENYLKHNIQSMNPELLQQIALAAGLQEVKCYYYGRFSVWLENENTLSPLTRMFKKLTWFSGKVLTKILPFESKALSPYIVLEAQKPL